MEGLYAKQGWGRLNGGSPVGGGGGGAIGRTAVANNGCDGHDEGDKCGAHKGLDKVEQARTKEANRLRSLHEEVHDVQERILAMEAKEKAKGNALKRNAVELEEQLVQGKEVLGSNKKESARLNKEIGKAESKGSQERERRGASSSVALAGFNGNDDNKGDAKGIRNNWGVGIVHKFDLQRLICKLKG
jgi:hypothetical protein